MKRIIGIDFGTSTTYMNVKRYNGNQPVEDRFSYMPVVFNYGESSGFVSSIVRENADGSFDFGEKAAEQLEGAKIYRETKMNLESTDEARREEARRIVRQFFKFLYETYNQQSANLGGAEDEEETIVSYPVKWQKETAEFMLEAARDAGFRNVRGMDEADAAVATVLCHNDSSNLICADKPGYLMLVDMGAGTTDLVLCRYRADGRGGIHVELVSSWPRSAQEPTFGGREIDRVLEKYVEDYLAKALVPGLAAQAGVIAATPGQAKMWKERNVSVNLAAGKDVKTCAYIATYRSVGMLTGEFPAFGRETFEQIAGNGLQDYTRLLLGCLEDAQQKDPEFKKNGLDLVILTGGHSAWYFAREIVDGTMAGYLDHPALNKVRSQRQRVANLPNPQTTVSLGLVYSKLPLKIQQRQEPEAAPVREERPAQEPVQKPVQPREERKRAPEPVKPGAKPTGTAIEPFAMAVDDAYHIASRGLVITGLISSGSVSEGDRIEALQAGRTVAWGKVGMMTDLKDSVNILRADAGTMVGLLLPGVEKGRIRKGMMIRIQEQPIHSTAAREEERRPLRQEQPRPVQTRTRPVEQEDEYDTTRCPKCGAPIPDNARKCPVCGRARLRELITPYKVGLVSWYLGDRKLGIAKATGTLTILDDRIEYKKNFGNTAAALTPYSAIYSLAKANMDPKEIIWLRDVVAVKRSVYGGVAPAMVLTMRDGNMHTFSTGLNTQASEDAIRGAVKLLSLLIRP